ncbi:hypothetical protein [Nonomuraea candida]|uniref:hypothetical protein n=1 Tax=Nonomuraea candida TaxID=359159 RepID=UPI0005BD43B9|nr:hypothetical protein [Nonomuraea candida]
MAKPKKAEELVKGDHITLWAQLWGEVVAEVAGIEVCEEDGEVRISLVEIEWAELVVEIGQDIEMEG